MVGRELEEDFDGNKKQFWARIKRLNRESGVCGTGAVSVKMVSWW